MGDWRLRRSIGAGELGRREDGKQLAGGGWQEAERTGELETRRERKGEAMAERRGEGAGGHGRWGAEEMGRSREREIWRQGASEARGLGDDYMAGVVSTSRGWRFSASAARSSRLSAAAKVIASPSVLLRQSAEAR